MNGWGLTNRPAVTVSNAVGRGLIGGQGAKDNILAEMKSGFWIDSPHGDASSYAEKTRITESEAGQLQGYPAAMVWPNTGRSSTFLQIGNAVPPPVAKAVFEALWT